LKHLHTYLCDRKDSSNIEIYIYIYISTIITFNNIAAGPRSILDFNIRERGRACARCMLQFCAVTSISPRISLSKLPPKRRRGWPRYQVWTSIFSCDEIERKRFRNMKFQKFPKYYFTLITANILTKLLFAIMYRVNGTSETWKLIYCCLIFDTLPEKGRWLRLTKKVYCNSFTYTTVV